MSQDLSNFKPSDSRKLLTELGDESTTPDRIKSILKIFNNFISDNTDIALELLGCRIVENLIELYDSAKGRTFRGQIASILSLLSFEGNENVEKNISDITLTALSNIFLRSDSSVFLQCLTGMRSITTNTTPSSSSAPFSSSTPSSSAPPTPPRNYLSVSSSAVVLERAAALLSSSAVKERVKVDLMDELLQLVDAGVMNEAAEFAEWRSSGERGGGGGGGGEAKKDDSSIPAARFVKAFEAFALVIKGISLVDKKSVLRSAAEVMYKSIQEKKFFPTLVTVSLVKPEPEKKTNANFPLKFLPNPSASFVTNSGSKLTWNGQGHKSFFVEPDITRDIYKVVFECNGVSFGGNGPFLGLAASNRLDAIASSHLFVNGACMIWNSYISINGKNIVNHNFFPSSGKATIGLELDADKHVLYFFVNNTQIPYTVTKVASSVHFGVSDYTTGNSIEIKSLAKLTTPSINAYMACNQIGWE